MSPFGTCLAVAWLYWGPLHRSTLSEDANAHLHGLDLSSCSDEAESAGMAVNMASRLVTMACLGAFACAHTRGNQTILKQATV